MNAHTINTTLLLLLLLVCNSLHIPLPPPPLYNNKDVNLDILFPASNEIIYGGTIYVNWGVVIYNSIAEKNWKHNQHKHAAHFILRHRSNIAQIIASWDQSTDIYQFPQITELAPGQYVLEGWLIDTLIPKGKIGHVLSDKVQIFLETKIFESVTNNQQDIDMTENDTNENVTNSLWHVATKQQEISSLIISPHCVVGNILRDMVATNNVIQQEFQQNGVGQYTKSDHQTQHTTGRQDESWQSILNVPDYNNAIQNILRAGFVTQYLPVLSGLPIQNVKWYRTVVSSNNMQLVNAMGKTNAINTLAWFHGGKRMCSNIEEIAKERVVKEELEVGSQEKGNGNGNSNEDGSRASENSIVVAFGKDTGNDLVILYGKETAAQWFVHGKQRIVATKDAVNATVPKHITLYVGTSPDFDHKSASFICALGEMPLVQQCAIFGGGAIHGSSHKYQTKIAMRAFDGR